MAAFVKQIMFEAGMEVLSDLSTEASVCGVGTLRTGSANAKGEKISVGILARVEINAGAQAYRLTVRTAHAAVSEFVHVGMSKRLVG